MEKSIRQQLLELGMKEEEMDNHASDLYVLKNEISSKWLETYEYKTQVTTFRSELNKNEIWYDIPFGYMPEHYAKRGY